MIVGSTQNLDLNYRIKQSGVEYFLSYNIGTAKNLELGHEKQVILGQLIC